MVQVRNYVLFLALAIGSAACSLGNPEPAKPDFAFEGALPLQGMLTYKP